MKKVKFFIPGIVFLSGCVYTPYQYLNYEKEAPIVISERVGKTIEPEEREKFGLFQGIEGFKSATFYEILRGGYETVILTENQKLAAVNRDSLAIPILRDYINRYEEIKSSRAEFEKKWGIVDYDDLGQPITQWEVNRVKQRFYTTGCGAACCLLGIIPNAILSYIIGTSFPPEHLTYRCGDFFPEPNMTVFLLTFVLGTAVTTGIGATRGNRMDRDNAIKVIKKGRKPRVIK